MPVKHVHKSLASINEKTFYLNRNTNEKTKIALFYVNFVCSAIIYFGQGKYVF